jgi:hypothetical protein
MGKAAELANGKTALTHGHDSIAEWVDRYRFMLASRKGRVSQSWPDS